MGTDVQAEQGQVTKEGKSFQQKLFLFIYWCNLLTFLLTNLSHLMIFYLYKNISDMYKMCDWMVIKCAEFYIESIFKQANYLLCEGIVK